MLVKMHQQVYIILKCSGFEQNIFKILNVHVGIPYQVSWAPIYRCGVHWNAHSHFEQVSDIALHLYNNSSKLVGSTTALKSINEGVEHSSIPFQPAASSVQYGRKVVCLYSTIRCIIFDRKYTFSCSSTSPKS